LKGLPYARPILDFPPSADRAVLLAGTVRSGTTWVSGVINYAGQYRYLFEPLHPDLACARHIPPRLYLTPNARRPALQRKIAAILGGRVRDPRVDQFNTRSVSTRRLIKVIHANLMLPWVHHRFPGMPIVLLLRHPCAVVNSLLRLGWDPALGHIRAQDALMSGPLAPVRELLDQADTPFEEHLLLWCAETFIPLTQMSPADVHLLFYEHLCESPMAEAQALFDFLGQPLDARVADAIAAPSALARSDSPIACGGDLVTRWRSRLSSQQVQRVMDVLARFGLDRIYSEDPMPNAAAALQLMSGRSSFQAGLGTWWDEGTKGQ